MLLSEIWLTRRPMRRHNFQDFMAPPEFLESVRVTTFQNRATAGRPWGDSSSDWTVCKCHHTVVIPNKRRWPPVRRQDGCRRVAVWNLLIIRWFWGLWRPFQSIILLLSPFSWTATTGPPNEAGQPLTNVKRPSGHHKMLHFS